MPGLEPDLAEVRALIDRVLRGVEPFFARWAAGTMTSPVGGQKIARQVRRSWPEEGTSLDAALAIVQRAAEASLDAGAPGYLAYVPGGGLPYAAVADLYADLVNRFTGLALPAPALVALEVDVVRWLCAMVGYGAEAGGLLTSGGSLANLAAVVAARWRAFPDRPFAEARVYRTGQVHHSVDKAARVAGFTTDALVEVAVDGRHRMSVADLAARISADRAAGRVPLLVVANGGSTALGAVDDLQALADLCAAEGVWLHVDGAYGGCFALTERGRSALAGLERADSIALDPHKGLFLPYGTGCVLVRRLSDLRDAHRVDSAYLPDPSDDDATWDFADLGPELSRPFRGLRVWLPVMLLGFGAFRDALDEKLDLAQRAAEGVRALPDVRIVAEPTLSLFAFRAEPAGMSVEDADRLNKRWIHAVNQRRRVFLSGADVVDPALGRRCFVIRVCVLSFRTHQAQVDALLEDLAATQDRAPSPSGSPS